MLQQMFPSQSFKVFTFLAIIIPLARSLQAKTTASANISIERSLASSILESLRQRTSSQQGLLHLATDFYDLSTGLHSEGVWHNSLVGIASLRLSQKDEARNIADSLWNYSWDGTSFQRRAHSGRWDHSTDLGLEQANYYRESAEHRCIQHGMALVFWSLLAAQIDAESMYKDQQHLIAASFLREFWNEKEDKWHTVSQTQGWGTIDRPSASAGKCSTSLVGEDRTNNSGNDYYYRAADQAVALLACLVAMHTLPSCGTEKEQMEEITKKTCQTLLDAESGGFGYAHDDSAQSYISLTRNRNFWHDGWVALALICAERRGYLVHQQKTQLRSLVRKLVVRYGHPKVGKAETLVSESKYDGTLWHWPTSLKADEASGNVRYCGDNALWYAIRQNFNHDDDDNDSSFLSSQQEDDRAFWKFVDSLCSEDKDGLASVADVYKQVRLHPNTELACLVLWQFDEFFSD